MSETKQDNRHVDRVNLIAALTASLVGVCALVVSVYASYWQKQAARAQVRETRSRR